MSSKKVSLGSVAKVLNGFAFKSKEYVDCGIRVIRITNVQKGKIVDYDPKYIHIDRLEEFNKYEIVHGDILVSLTGNVGRVGVFQKEYEPAVLNQRVGLIKKTSEEIDKNYLFTILNSEKFENAAIRNSNGVAQLNLSSKWVESYKIPLPPKEDQIRTATLLSRVEALIATRKNNLQQLDDFLKSTFLGMFGDPVRNEKGWDKEPLGNHSSSRLGKMRDKQFITGNYLRPYIGNSNVQWFEINTKDLLEMDFNEKEREIFHLEYGDLLVCEGGDIGRCAIWKNQREDCYFQKALHRVRVGERLKAEFLQYVFKFYSERNGFKNVTSKATIAHLTGVKLKETLVPLPPKILQGSFAEIISKVESLMVVYKFSLNELENLYGIFSQKAFKGELDLSRVPLPEEPEPIAHDGNLAGQIAGSDEATLTVEYPMSDPDERKKLLHSLLDNYLKEQQGKMFSLDDFWQQADFKVLDELDESDQSWGVKDYDQVKDWLFELIREGKLEQAFVEDSGEIRDSQIELTVKG